MLRLQIISTGTFFVMPADQSLTIDIQTVLFNASNALLGSISYPGKLELVEENKAAIKNAQHILTSKSLRKLDVLMWLGWMPYKQVVFEFTIENGYINYNLNIDMTIFANRLKTLTMSQLVLPEADQVSFDNPAAQQAYMLATATDVPGTHPAIYFPFKNNGAYKTIDPSAYGDYRDIALPWNPYINPWQVVAGVGSFIANTSAPYNNTNIPAFCLPYIFRRIATFFGFKITGKWLTEDTSNRILVLPMVPSISGIQADMTYYMPNMLVADFITEIRSNLGLFVDFDVTRGVCICESLANLVASPDTVDLRGKQLLGYRETGTVPDAYTITQVFDDKDTAFTDAEKTLPVALEVGDVNTAISVTAVQLSAVATKMLAEVSPAAAGAQTWRIPWVTQPVNGATPFDQISDVGYVDRDKFKLRLVFYHGMQPDAGGFNYPYASSDNLDFNGNPLTAFTLALNAAGAAYLSIKKYFTFIKSSKPAEFDFELSAMELISIKANSRILVKDFNQATVTCLLDQLSADINRDETYMVKLTMYPILFEDNTAQVLPLIPVVPPPPPVDNGTVWVRLSLRNPTTFVSMIPPHYETFQNDIWVEFYEDEAATIPKNVTSLNVSFQSQWFDNGFLFSSGTITEICNTLTHDFQLEPNASTSSNQGEHNYNWTYTLIPNIHYNIIS